MNTRQALFILVVFALATMAFGETLSETVLGDAGFEDFAVEGQNTEKCREVQFISTAPVNPDAFAVFSANVEFFPVASSESLVTVFLNGAKISEVEAENFTNGFARVELPKNKTLETNKLKVCLKTSYSTTKMVLKKESFVGDYLKPDFSESSAFRLSIEPYLPRLFEEFKVTATLKNSGSQDAIVTLKYRKDHLENETPETSLVKGKTIIENVKVEKCRERKENGECSSPGTVSFEYYLRPKISGTITLLPAIAEFENIFGEKTVLESNRPFVTITVPAVKIRSFISVPKKEYVAGEKATLLLVMSNDSFTPALNVTGKIEPTNNLQAQGEKSFLFDSIEGKQTVEKEFSVTSAQPGVFEVDCSVVLADGTKLPCEKATIEFKEPGFSPQIAGGIVLLLIGAVVYGYIFYIRK